MATKLDLVAFEVVVRHQIWPVLPVIIVDCSSGLIFYCSASAARLFGCEPNVMVGTPMGAWLPSFHVVAPAEPPHFSSELLVGKHEAGHDMILRVGVADIRALDTDLNIILVMEANNHANGPK